MNKIEVTETEEGDILLRLPKEVWESSAFADGARMEIRIEEGAIVLAPVD